MLRRTSTNTVVYHEGKVRLTIETNMTIDESIRTTDHYQITCNGQSILMDRSEYASLREIFRALLGVEESEDA